MDELARQLEGLLRELSPSLTEFDIESIRDLIEHNEIGVAFEDFCTQLNERGAVCSPEQVARMAAIGGAMGIDPWYWGIVRTSE
jgi:hypothetical protein